MVISQVLGSIYPNIDPSIIDNISITNHLYLSANTVL